MFIPLYTLGADEQVRFEVQAKTTVVGAPSDAMTCHGIMLVAEVGGVLNSSTSCSSQISGNVAIISAMIIASVSGLDVGVLINFQSATPVTVDVDAEFTITRLD